jgi:membrane dipeptidase
LENPTENFTNITRWMVQQGFSDAHIQAALGGNIMRALGAIWV